MNDVSNIEKSNTEQSNSELSNAIDSVRTNLTNARLASLGLFNKLNEEAKVYIDSIKARGEEKLEEVGELESDKLVDRVSMAMAKAINQSRAYGLASYEEASDNGQKLADWVKNTIESANEEEAESVSRAARNVELANKVVSSLAKDAYESAESFLADAKELGKDVDHELRKVVFGRQASLEERVQRFWKALGLVNKRELEELNRKLVALAESVESQLDEESKSLVYLNRRKNDRRVKQTPVAVDKRVHLRREIDKRLAS